MPQSRAHEREKELHAKTVVLASNNAPALDDPDQEDDDRNDEQDVNEAAQRVSGNEAERPEHEQNHENGPQHDFLLHFERQETVQRRIKRDACQNQRGVSS